MVVARCNGTRRSIKGKSIREVTLSHWAVTALSQMRTWTKRMQVGARGLIMQIRLFAAASAGHDALGITDRSEHKYSRRTFLSVTGFASMRSPGEVRNIACCLTLSVPSVSLG